MIILNCERCNKKQSQGRFCLDCGGVLEEVVTSAIKFKPIVGGGYTDQHKKKIIHWLSRVGVQESDVQFNSDGRSAEVSYALNGKTYKFSSILQSKQNSNFAAINIFIHNRVIGIERGIEQAEQAFAGYEALPNYSAEYAFDNCKTLVEVDEIWKKLVKQHHPDVGGEPGQFQKLQEKYKEARNKYV